MTGGSNALTFAVTPHLQDETTLAALDEICELLSVDVGLPVRPHCAASPADLASVLGQPPGDRGRQATNALAAASKVVRAGRKRKPPETAPGSSERGRGFRGVVKA